MSDNEEFEERLARLEDTASHLFEIGNLRMAEHKMETAHFTALKSIVAELAKEAELPFEEFNRHFKMRSEFWHDYLLKQTEDHSPTLAAEFAKLREISASAPEPYPPLFPEAGSQEPTP